MPEPLTLERLVEAGVHFGCRANRWNPKMRPYILSKRSSIHLIDLRATLRGLLRAENFLARLAGTGAQVLFVGTKRSVRGVVEEQAKRCGMPFVTERWIGGTLTNFGVIRKRLSRLEELEKMEEDGSLERYSKKVIASLRRERRKITRNLEGIRTLTELPGAVVIVDPKREDIAAKEARRSGVPCLCLLDTDCDPDFADIPIPGNDDAIKSVGLLLARLADAVLEGRGRLEVEEAPAPPPEIEGPREPRPSRSSGTIRPGEPRQRTPPRDAQTPDAGVVPVGTRETPRRSESD